MTAPTRIMIIRHGEKPTTKAQPPFGLAADGNQNWESLTVRGWQRAGALADLFNPARGPLQEEKLAAPDLIYASKPALKGFGPDPDESAGGSKSQRPLQTITPLAAKLGITPNLTFAKGDEKLLVQDILSRNGNMLISWQHERIPKIAEHLLGGVASNNPIPQVWPPDRFDVVWVFTTPALPNGSWGFFQVPERLLDGDGETGI